MCNSCLRIPPPYATDMDQLRREALQAAATDESFGPPMTAVTRRQCIVCMDFVSFLYSEN